MTDDMMNLRQLVEKTPDAEKVGDKHRANRRRYEQFREDVRSEVPPPIVEP